MPRFKEHRCFKVVNRELAKHDTALEQGLFDPNQVFLSTYKMNGKRGQAKRILASYCPFCGEELVLSDRWNLKTKVTV